MSTTPTSAAQFFGAMVESYDSLIRRAVPRYDEMIDRLVEHLPLGAARVLELGCGTGNLTLRLLESLPAARITTVDAAPEMTEIAAERARHAANLTTLTARFEDLSFAPATFDLITSCMSLHHVRDKAALYTALRTWLTPGGRLCIADQLLGVDAETQRIFWERWLEFCRLPGHCSEDEVKSLVDHAAAHDHYTPLAEHFDLLRAAKFRVTDCAWRNQMYTVLIAA